ncbi:GTP-binding protein Rho1 like protein [Argiope bruennichi]|uniref:GTP-binding protein Rho1 like protein n=1 Tax=Argiope bruennichi TaxID=94029 RepID=A0A8T0FGL1_ARGBR|nr:GTP-binding protein Rho1 like protein [Argiope bruennichi]
MNFIGDKYTQKNQKLRNFYFSNNIMDFTSGHKNRFSSNMHYNYFSGNGFNLGQDIYSFFAKSSENDLCHPKYHNKCPPQCFEDDERKRTHSCPLPTPKRRFDNNQVLSPVVDEFPDNKLDFKGIDVVPEETLNILVTGPPHCGKTRIVEALAKSKLQIQADGGPNIAFSQSFAMLGIKVHVNVWYMKNPKDCTKSLKDEFPDKNFAIILVYDVTVPKTLFDVREYILGFKRVFGINVPIILVGNKTDMRALITNELSMLDWGLLAYSDGQQVKNEYKLADFVECPGETGYGMDDMLFKASTVVLGNYFKF